MSRGVDAELDARFSVECGRQHVHCRTSPALELRGPFETRRPLPYYYMRNTTCGVFATDRYDVRVSVEDGARVQVASSSATKVFAMKSDEASLSTTLRASSGSLIVWGPQPVILQAGSSLRQRTKVELHDDAIVIVSDVLVLGRLASGEQHRFQRVDGGLSVWRDGKASFDERYALRPGPDLTASLGGRGVLVSIYGLGLGPDAIHVLRTELSGLSDGLSGFSTLPNDAGIVGRCLAKTLSDGLSFAETCNRLLTAFTASRAVSRIRIEESA